ncbi:hypothetical protein ABKN59_005583 [Abortiporus biennis]
MDDVHSLVEVSIFDILEYHRRIIPCCDLRDSTSYNTPSPVYRYLTSLRPHAMKQSARTRHGPIMYYKAKFGIDIQVAIAIQSRLRGEIQMLLRERILGTDSRLIRISIEIFRIYNPAISEPLIGFRPRDKPIYRNVSELAVGCHNLKREINTRAHFLNGYYTNNHTYTYVYSPISNLKALWLPHSFSRVPARQGKQTEGTGYVARNVYNWSEKSNLKAEITVRPDIACYKQREDGTTPFDLPSQEDTSVSSNSVLTSSEVSETTTDTMLTDKPIPSKKDFSNDLDDSDEENPSLESPDPDASASPQETDKKKIPHPFAARMDYTSCRLTVEDKTDHLSASFNLESSTLEEFLPKGTDRIHTQGQISEHATAIIERQHRTHFFNVVTIGITVRFLRWDRAGVIVTKPIAFNKDLTRFVKFFYRFARLIPEQHGEDLSILKPEAEDLEALENFRINKAPNLVPNHQEFFRHAFFDHQKHYPIVKVHLDMLQSPPKISLDNRPEPS